MSLFKLEDYSLSDTDIRKVLGNVNIISYPALANVKSLFDILDSKDRCVIFFEEAESKGNFQGHWECIFVNRDEQNKKTINFFDSYGLIYDQCREWLTKQKLMKLKEFTPQLHRLFYEASQRGYRVVFNHKQLQSYKGNVSTCGRWVCTRLLKQELTNAEFIQFIEDYRVKNNLKTLDLAVTMYIFQILGK